MPAQRSCCEAHGCSQGGGGAGKRKIVIGCRFEIFFKGLISLERLESDHKAKSI